MSSKARAIDAAGQLDELTFEPVREPEGRPAMGLIPESLRRCEPERIIR